MKMFSELADVSDLKALTDLAFKMKENPLLFDKVGKGKTIGLLFFNPSLRTRLSTQKAALNLGMNCIVMNVNGDGWQIEFEDGAIMDQGNQEHIKEAAGVLSQYCDVIGVRSFPSLVDKTEDYNEKVLNSFIQHATVPIISLESATRHPLQSFADLITIQEFKTVQKPKVVLTWAPHTKVLPQSVPNSFLEWMLESDVDLTITNPVGYNLSEEFTQGQEVNHNQDDALKNADFVYVKNWSSFENYGQISEENKDWKITQEKMNLTNKAKLMHCLPVRRNVVITDEVLDSKNSIVLQQAKNREYSAQAVLYKILTHEN